METPYIGASISLISKSEIRYEGILFTIDTKESNIALQSGARNATRPPGGGCGRRPARRPHGSRALGCGARGCGVGRATRSLQHCTRN
jgi:hypothetical protein